MDEAHLHKILERSWLMDNLIRDRIVFAIFVAAVLVLVLIAITVMLAFLINASKNNDHTVESVQPVQLEKARSGFARAKKSAISAPTQKEIANVCRVDTVLERNRIRAIPVERQDRLNRIL